MKKLLSSFRYAFAGLTQAARQRNMRIHLCFSFYVLIMAAVVAIEAAEWAAVLICIALVLTAECFNTAIETLCDALHPEWSEKIGRVKDLSAASVLISASISAAVGCMVFFRAGRPRRALELIFFNPAAAAALLLSLIIWIQIIFRETERDSDDR